jgi:hypothetical protein
LLEKCYARCRLLLILLTALCALPARATTQEVRTGADLVRASEAIVVGRCAAVSTEWRDRALVTRYTITVDDSLKGEVGSELTLYLPGGVDNDRKIPIAVTVPGAPTLFAREEVLLFLRDVPEAGGYSLLSLAQGKHTVHRDAGGEGWLSFETAGSVARRSLESIKAEIRAFVAQEEGR